MTLGDDPLWTLLLAAITVLAGTLGGLVITLPPTTVWVALKLRRIHFCPTVHCANNCPYVDDAGTLLVTPDITACFLSAAQGALRENDAGCLTFSGEGTGVWQQTPQPCSLSVQDGGYVPTADLFELRSTTSTGVLARFQHTLEPYAVEELVRDDPDCRPLVTFASDFVPDRDDVLRLLAGQRVALPVALDDDVGIVPVGYRLADATFEITETQPATDGGPAAVVERLREGEFPVIIMAAGGEVSVRMRLFGEAFDVGTVRGVSAEVLSDIFIYRFVQNPADQAVLGLRALVRDVNVSRCSGCPWPGSSSAAASSSTISRR